MMVVLRVQSHKSELTHISWCAARCGHHAVLQHLGQTKVTHHDLCIFICVVVQQVLGLLRDTKGERRHNH